MNISNDLLITIGSILFGGGTAWGVAKTALRNKVDWPEHNNLCHEKSKEVYDKIDEVQKNVSEQTGEILRAIGRLEGKMERRG